MAATQALLEPQELFIPSYTFRSFRFYVVSRKVRDYCSCVPGVSGRLCAVSWDSPWLFPFAWYVKISLSQKKCKAQRSMWMRYEGKFLGMLFVPWPSSFPAAVFSKVYVKFEFLLCLNSSHGIPAWEGGAVASPAPLCPLSHTVLFCGPCLPIIKVQYIICLFSKSLQVWETQNCVRVYFLPSDFSIIWVIYGWDKLPGSSVCYHSNDTPGNKSSSQLFCIFFYVSAAGVCWMILTAQMLLALACCAVQARSCNLDVGELLPCILHSGLLSVDSICNLLFLIDGAVESEGWPWDVSTKDAFLQGLCLSCNYQICVAASLLFTADWRACANATDDSEIFWKIDITSNLSDQESSRILFYYPRLV